MIILYTYHITIGMNIHNKNKLNKPFNNIFITYIVTYKKFRKMYKNFIISRKRKMNINNQFGVDDLTDPSRYTIHRP